MKEYARTKLSSKNNIDCSICKKHEVSMTNPIFKVCKCPGFSGFAHLECEKKRLLGLAVEVRSEAVGLVSINWKKFECPKCKTRLPFDIIVGGEVKRLVQYKEPSNKPYMVLESLLHPIEDNSSRSIHIICGSNSMIDVGQ